jgi:hypothetical protein
MLRRLLTAATVALLGAGCSLLLDTAEPTQCSTDRDCEASPSLRNRTCQSGFCVIPGVTDPQVVTPDAGPGCVTTELCTQDNSGQLSVCKVKGGPCQIWQTAQCRLRTPLAGDPNAIVIGSILPLTVRQYDGAVVTSDYADRVRRSIDLAVSDFTTQLPGGILLADGKRHPLAVLHCDSGLTAEGAKLAMKHLTEVVGAQALIVGSDEEITAIADDATAKKTAIACEGCLGKLPQGPLAWRIVPRLELEAPMVNWRVSKLEEERMALPSPPAQIKVALLTNNERVTTDFVAKLRTVLRFNGGQTIAQNGANFQTFLAEDPRVTSVNHQKHVKDIIAFEPDIVVVAMTGDFGNYYLPGIEAGWTGARRPAYITTALNYTLGLANAIGSDEDLRKRISGTRPGYAAPLQANIDDYDDRYRTANDFKEPDGNYSGYDAFYSLGMAVLAARVQPIMDGVHISAGFERLRSGTVIDFTPQKITTAAITLGETAASIDVRGLWSNLDWNLTTHDLDSDVSMYCYKRDATSSLVIQPNAGPHLTTATGVVDGVYSCD